MGKVFGYPEFDENGEKILTTYDNDYRNDDGHSCVSHESRSDKNLLKNR